MTRDGFNFDGGSASRLEDGRILVAFTSPYDNRLWNDKYSMHAYVDLTRCFLYSRLPSVNIASPSGKPVRCNNVGVTARYEVDKDGRAVIEIVVPHTGSLGSQGSYRFIPMKTVDMENTVAPFASVEGDDDDADDA